MDMFSRFGRDLKVPNVDVEAILSHHRKNLEALEKSAKAGAAGASSLLSRQREMLQDTLREVSDMAQNYKAPGNPQELMAKEAQAEPRPERTAEEREVIREVKRRHYQHWVDEELPVLGGKTPREAARTPNGRAKLEVLLRHIENIEAGHHQDERYDVAVLRDELGLP